MKRMLVIIMILAVFIIGTAFAFGQPRKIITCVVVPCDEPAHFLIKDNQFIQLQALSEIVKVIPETDEKGNENLWAVDFNKHTLVIAIDTLDPQKWHDAAYILASLPHLYRDPIDPYNLCLIEDWQPKACKIGYGMQTNAMFNQYIAWWRGSETWPSKELCEAKIGKIR